MIEYEKKYGNNCEGIKQKIIRTEIDTNKLVKKQRRKEKNEVKCNIQLLRYNNSITDTCMCIYTI